MTTIQSLQLIYIDFKGIFTKKTNVITTENKCHS